MSQSLHRHVPWRPSLRESDVNTWYDAQVKPESVILQMPDKSIVEVPCGMVIWAAVSTRLLHLGDS